MSNINELKQYKQKLREYKQLEVRLKVINIELENWDNVKASGGVNGTAYKWNEEGQVEDAVIMPYGSKGFSSIVENSIIKREERELERFRAELELAHLSEWIINIDSLLDCLEYSYRYLLENIYKNGYIGKRNRQALHERYTKDVKIIGEKHLNCLINEAKDKFNNL